MTDKVSLTNWRFLSFLTAQFLGAFNDNAFKLVVSMASLSMILDPPFPDISMARRQFSLV